MFKFKCHACGHVSDFDTLDELIITMTHPLDDEILVETGYNCQECGTFHGGTEYIKFIAST